MKKYDAIVIGAGNSGLSCAATLVGGGFRVLVLERNNVPGGSATGFRRGRFDFEASLHELANIGEPEQGGTLRRLLESYGADVEWCTEKNAFRAIAGGEDGYDITVPSGIDDFVEKIEAEVPGSRESLLEVFALARRLDAAIAYMSGGKPDPAVLASEHADFLRMASHSVDECLEALGMPKKAQNILKTYWPYLGASTDKLDFAHYLILLDRYIRIYPALPSMRSHELSLAVADVIRAKGGEIRYNSEVSEILFDGKRAVGVSVGGERIYADFIIANSYPDITYRKMIDKDKIPERAIKLANARKQGSIFFTVYLGLNRSADELGIKDYSVFLFDTPQSVEQYASIKQLDNSMLIVNCLNKVVPNASPAGTSMLYLTKLLDGDAWGEVKPQDYKKLKNSLAQEMIENYEKRMNLSIMPYIEEIVIAAPPTFARYLNTPNGTPYGYESQPWDSMILRIMNSRSEQFFDRLYFVGAYGERSDGYSTTYALGNSVGKKILKEAARHE